VADLSWSVNAAFRAHEHWGEIWSTHVLDCRLSPQTCTADVGCRNPPILPC
jgi:hypothetical protein